MEFGLVLSLDLEGKKISSKVRKIKKTIKKILITVISISIIIIRTKMHGDYLITLTILKSRPS